LVGSAPGHVVVEVGHRQREEDGRAEAGQEEAEKNEDDACGRFYKTCFDYFVLFRLSLQVSIITYVVVSMFCCFDFFVVLSIITFVVVLVRRGLFADQSSIEECACQPWHVCLVHMYILLINRLQIQVT
jgi:hypothetical protein